MNTASIVERLHLIRGTKRVFFCGMPAYESDEIRDASFARLRSLSERKPSSLGDLDQRHHREQIRRFEENHRRSVDDQSVEPNSLDRLTAAP